MISCLVLVPQEAVALINEFLDENYGDTFSDYVAGTSKCEMTELPLGFVNWFEGFGYVFYVDQISGYSAPPSQSELDAFIGDSSSALADLYETKLLPRLKKSNKKFSDLSYLRVDVNPVAGEGIPLPH